MNARLFHYDYLRFFAVLCIIGIHSSDIVMQTDGEFNLQWWTGLLIQIVVRIGLPIFFMISGALLLSGKEESLSNFYLRRFSKIAIPLLVYSLIYLFVFNFKWTILHPMNFISAVKYILAGPVYYHLWFVYSLLGLYTIAPFIKVMVKNMSDKMLFHFGVIILFLFGLKTYLPVFGFGIGINNWVFESWIFYFILGYILSRIDIKNITKFIHVSALISLGFSILVLRYYPPLHANIFDLSPTMILITSSVFLLFENNKNKFNNSSKFFSFILTTSKYSYSIYLIHALTLSYFVHEKIGISGIWINPIVGVVSTVLLTFFISYILSIIIDNLITKNIINSFNYFAKKIETKIGKNHEINLKVPKN